MPALFTVAHRVCCRCGSEYARECWPWTGEVWTATHGYCEPCFLVWETEVGL